MNESLADYVQSIDEFELYLLDLKSRALNGIEIAKTLGNKALQVEQQRRVGLIADILEKLNDFFPEVDRDLVRKEVAFNRVQAFAEDEAMQEK